MYSGSLVRKVHRYAVVAWYIKMSEEMTMLSALPNIVNGGSSKLEQHSTLTSHYRLFHPLP
jgi:hypothetical protein